MPTYAYACTHCSHRFDIYQSFTEDTLTTCPECDTVSLRKVFSPVGVVFKGSGFYRTDSRSGQNSKSSSASASTSDSATGGSSETSSGAGDGQKSSAGEASSGSSNGSSSASSSTQKAASPSQ